ncbi:hypothetical protein SAMD00019534_049120 [Acytostelium subglobosum LB1]|uniref:hypothetical protein n=1 Tax=Acytostelium subglobosum LB1 TaxID=1410327 RepID=UPI000644F1B1|nr:hypothetical protein SAMD00019534_049120 [Acytostelium subglobosum LB1]GAM21737.1 hypothetical protein SAMD00019534_049120 [Acytostelium subglobosum LB1]|eukprot:XP_012754837.1 hypothetical protein SAMD00019534_049120 [Acytostelium subglobosum LB1]
MVLDELAQRPVELGIYFGAEATTLPVLQQANLKLLSIIGSQRQQLQRCHLPTTLQHLMLGSKFEGTLNGLLPDGLTNLDLSFSSEWNQLITPDSLPSKLETLTLSRSFNQEIHPRTFPPALKSIIFGKDFNQPLSGLLPPSLTHLDLSIWGDYHHDLANLPISLTSIHLPTRFRGTLNHPPLQFMRLHDPVRMGHPLLVLRELHIESLDHASVFDASLFPNISRLKVSREAQWLDLSTLPWTTLKRCKLVCEDSLETNISAIPFGVERLVLGNYSFDQATTDTLPSSITQLTLASCIGVKPGHIPPSVTSLKLKWTSMTEVIQAIPTTTSLRHLTLIDHQFRGWSLFVQRLPKSISTLFLSNVDQSLELVRLTDQLYFRVSQSIKEIGFMDTLAIQSIFALPAD